jgi:hypothetical protein
MRVKDFLHSLHEVSIGGHNWNAVRNNYFDKFNDYSTQAVMSELFYFGELFCSKVLHLLKEQIISLSKDEWIGIINSYHTEMELRQMILIIYWAFGLDYLALLNNHRSNSLVKDVLILLRDQPGLFKERKYFREANNLSGLPDLDITFD